MNYKKIISLLATYCLGFLSLNVSAQEIPLPEHPRPDFMRKHWINLNGTWDFSFDKENLGLKENWFSQHDYEQKILVPFPWGSKLSGVENQADIAWYKRSIEIPASFANKRVFMVIGASDWITDVWIDGNHLGRHQGGYTPFEFELTPYISINKTHNICIRVDDTAHDFKLEGKQGYGQAKGIWQTVYLEARGEVAFRHVHFTPDIDNSTLRVKATLDQPAPENMTISLEFPNGEISSSLPAQKMKKNSEQIEFDINIPDQHLWSLEDPYLYDVSINLHGKNIEYDHVLSYFGMRKISVVNLPGTAFPYVSLNNQPLYLQLCLDQAYHPEGFYTYPSDEFMRDEILRSKRIGLNGNRVHIKVEIPRKLYWADKLGLLIMADVPNFWGEPNDTAKAEWEFTMRRMLERDYNHPSIFSWILFNETWGLFSGQNKQRAYLPETQEWVAKKFAEACKLDQTRIIEDNSACNYDHVITDLNSWHAYLPGYEWEKFLDNAVKETYEGSGWNYIGDYKQAKAPMINSECGNVWGYEGSTGDVDWSWDYHIMMNEFRKHPKIAGWLYTEHHDVINEWNGYYKYDRTEKYTGLSDFIPEMDLKHLHSLVYLSTGSGLCRLAAPDSRVSVPLYLSVMTDKVPKDHFILEYSLAGINSSGISVEETGSEQKILSSAYFNGEVEPLNIKLPDEPGLYHLRLKLKDESDFIYHLNFTSFLVEAEENEQSDKLLSFDPASFSESDWSLKQWNVMDGLKVNGAGSGYFSYDVPLPENLESDSIKDITLVFEASAKELFGKDQVGKEQVDGDYMRGKGTFNNSINPNSYPMTDTYKSPSLLRVRINGLMLGEFILEDDPADHRGTLSWFSQEKNRRLNEAGSYGYLCKIKIPVELLQKSINGNLNIRFEVDESLPGGLAIYGKRFGRYPFDPTLIFE